MATVRFTPHLSRFFPLPAEYVTSADSLAALVKELDARWPGLGFYIADERGALRQHVAVWVDGELIRDRNQLADPLDPGSHVTILQALTGGCPRRRKHEMATTSDRVWIGTRKGLLELRRSGGRWALGEMTLAGQPIAYACHDPRDGSIWASIDHGHWGVKLSRSTDDGETLAFATTSGNLYVSEDGGASWSCLTNNLPLVYSVRFA